MKVDVYKDKCVECGEQDDCVEAEGDSLCLECAYPLGPPSDLELVFPGDVEEDDVEDIEDTVPLLEEGIGALEDGEKIHDLGLERPSSSVWD